MFLGLLDQRMVEEEEVSEGRMELKGMEEDVGMVKRVVGLKTGMGRVKRVEGLKKGMERVKRVVDLKMGMIKVAGLQLVIYSSMKLVMIYVLFSCKWCRSFYSV